MVGPKTKDVLIVDDDSAIRGLLALALARLRVTSDGAIDGQNALEHFPVTRYAVVLVDLMMPRVDGSAFVMALREREQEAAERPVILMMSAFPDRERAAEFGAVIQAVIQKPFDVVQLAELVRDCVDVRRLHDAELTETSGTPHVLPVRADEA